MTFVDLVLDSLPLVVFVGALFVALHFRAKREMESTVDKLRAELLRERAPGRQHGAPVYSTEPDLDDLPLPETPTRVSLPVVAPEPVTCATCNHFDLAAGQKTIAANPAFATATTHLAPWQMARERKVRPNPEYLETEAALKAAQAEGDVERTRELHDRLLTLDPGEVLPDEEQVEREMLKLDWAKLGACGHHRELRFATDRCEAYETEV